MNKTNINLIPNHINPSPDYYCTWQTQLYATNDGKPLKQREIIGEKALFDTNKPFGWAYFYEKARQDLILVMDDSWDVPPDGDTEYYGSLILNEEKFPESVKDAKTNAEALKNLTDKIMKLGWKGLGGWICAQESKKYLNGKSIEEYWSQRFKEAQKSGFSYWKVDWGTKGTNTDFRKMLSFLGKQIAPDLTIEHAVAKDVISYSDVYRTYDVPAIMSIPMTINKLKEILITKNPQKGYNQLINCEDEAYIAAAGGFTMGIMRHPYSGPFINGTADMSFPQVHRNLKTKMYEVLRAVRWHRISPAFGIDKCKTYIDTAELCDSWNFINKNEELEEWWFDTPFFKDQIKDNTITKSAPSRISRNCTLPKVSSDDNTSVPYVVASKNPNGAFSVATLGRTIGRCYEIPKCDITLNIENSGIIGAFGEYGNLILETSHTKIKSVLMQDIADDFAYDITEEITFYDTKIIIPGRLISKIGTISQPDNDTSEPGVIIKLNI